MTKGHYRNVQSCDMEMSLLQLGSPLLTLVYMRIDSSLVLSQIYLNVFRTKINVYARTAVYREEHFWKSVQVSHLNHCMSVRQTNPSKQVNTGGFFEVLLMSVL